MSKHARPSSGQSHSSYIEVDGRKIFVTHASGHAPTTASPVIYVHGGTISSALTIGWSFDDGPSWARDLALAGHDVWAFDFAGFGRSERYREMRFAAAPGPIGRSDSAVRQLSAVVDHVRNATGKDRVALLAHSWGGLVACRLAAERPDSVERLVLFAPIVRREASEAPGADPSFPSWMAMTLSMQRQRFYDDVPAGEPPLITDAMFDAWSEAYLEADARNRETSDHAVAIPTGPQADVAAAWLGTIPYDPARILCPVHVVRGAWDSLCSDRDVAAFRASLTRCPSFYDAKLERGTHLMLLETERTRLWSAVRNGLAAALHAPVNTHCVLFEVLPTAAGREEYLKLAARLRPLLDEVDGFIAIDRLASRQGSGWSLSLQTWADDAAIAAWRNRDRHHFAQEHGRNVAFDDYRIRVARLVHDDALDDAEQPRGRSTYANPVRPGRYLGIFELLGPVGVGCPSPLDALAKDARDSDVFDSLYAPHRSAYVIGFETKAAADAWTSHALRVAANTRAAGTPCRVRVVETIRDYGMFDRAQAPAHHAPVTRRADAARRETCVD
jgi:pimeloyl-ACP methyl ester carboxylesterase/heme-degrading monooxygenase HmoA